MKERSVESKIRILIADDFPVLRDSLKELIEKQEDMTVVGMASSGTQMVELASKTDYDLILMDIEMESMVAGVVATQTIREENPEAKVIYLTAHETKEMILTAIGTGACDYIVKGGPEEELLTHIRQCAAGKPFMQQKIQEIVMQDYNRIKKSEENLVYFVETMSLLTKAEKELIGLFLENKKVKEIAEIRNVEVSTVKSQINTLLKKFNVSRTKKIVQKIKELNLTYLF